MKKQKKNYNIIKKKMQNKLIKIANDTNSFLKNFIKKQKKTELVTAMNYGLFPGGKKIRSKF